MLQVKSRAQAAIAKVRGGACATVLAASLIASAGMLGCSAGAGASQAEGAQEAVAAVTSTLTTESATASDLFASVQFFPQDYGVGQDAFAAWYFDGTDVQVADTDAQGDKATVHLSYTAKRMADVLPLLEQARDAALAAGASATQEGYANAQFDALAATAQVATDQLEAYVYLTRGSDGTWSIDDYAALAASLLDGYDPRQITVD